MFKLAVLGSIVTGGFGGRSAMRRLLSLAAVLRRGAVFRVWLGMY